MTKQKWIKLILEVIVVLGLLCAAAGIRAAMTYGNIYRSGEPQISSVDGYFFARNADTLLANWPTYSEYDPYRAYPDMSAINKSDLVYIYLMAGTAKLFNISVNTAGVWIPPILGVLAILFAYIAARVSLGRGPALIGIALLAVIPGEFLSRTVLGEADRHCLEILQSTLLMLFLLLSIKVTSQKMKIIWAALAGITLGIYLLSWAGSLMFVAIMVIAVFIGWLVSSLNELRSNPLKKQTIYLEAIICLVIAAIVTIIGERTINLQSSLVMSSAVGILALKITADRLLPKIRLILVGITGAIGFISTYIFLPNVFNALAGNVSALFIWRIGSATAEEAPLLVQNAIFSLQVPWAYFTGVIFLFLIGIGMLAYMVINKSNYKEKLLMLLWGTTLLFATLGMRRSAYYLAVPLCLIAGYFCWIFAKEIVVYIENKKKYISWGTTLLVVAGIAATALIPSYRESAGISQASAGNNIPSTWEEGLFWLKSNTPNPLPEGYALLYKSDYKYPESAYGVLSWWDYGYWIIRQSQRITYSDPGGGNRRYAGWSLTSDNITEIEESMRQLKIKYIIIDNSMVTGKYYSMVRHASELESDYQPQVTIGFDKRTGEYQRTQLFTPAYYRSLVVRLYNFNAGPEVSPGCPVFQYNDYNGFTEIVEVRDFTDLAAATSYINSQSTGKYMIAGSTPYKSILNLPALDHFRLVFASRGALDIGDGQLMPDVKIFEFTGE
jgi:dolichyl-diphosphooligosaccharide--protein glycosyltransferase